MFCMRVLNLGHVPPMLVSVHMPIGTKIPPLLANFVAVQRVIFLELTQLYFLASILV